MGLALAPAFTVCYWFAKAKPIAIGSQHLHLHPSPRTNDNDNNQKQNLHPSPRNKTCRCWVQKSNLLIEGNFFTSFELWLMFRCRRCAPTPWATREREAMATAAARRGRTRRTLRYRTWFLPWPVPPYATPPHSLNIIVW